MTALPFSHGVSGHSIWPSSGQHSPGSSNANWLVPGNEGQDQLLAPDEQHLDPPSKAKGWEGGQIGSSVLPTDKKSQIWELRTVCQGAVSRPESWPSYHVLFIQVMEKIFSISAIFVDWWFSVLPERFFNMRSYQMMCLRVIFLNDIEDCIIINCI